MLGILLLGSKSGFRESDQTMTQFGRWKSSQIEVIALNFFRLDLRIGSSKTEGSDSRLFFCEM